MTFVFFFSLSYRHVSLFQFAALEAHSLPVSPSSPRVQVARRTTSAKTFAKQHGRRPRRKCRRRGGGARAHSRHFCTLSSHGPTSLLRIVPVGEDFRAGKNTFLAREIVATSRAPARLCFPPRRPSLHILSRVTSCPLARAAAAATTTTAPRKASRSARPSRTIPSKVCARVFLSTFPRFAPAHLPRWLPGVSVGAGDRQTCVLLPSALRYLFGYSSLHSYRLCGQDMVKVYRHLMGTSFD